MKTEIIFWLNPKNGVIYHKTYNSYITREVGDENQFGHIVLAICIIVNKKLFCCDTCHDLYRNLDKETFKNKIIDRIINKLEKMKGR